MYCDSGFDHKDRTRIEGENSTEDRDKFYKSLYDFFFLIFKRKVQQEDSLL